MCEVYACLHMAGGTHRCRCMQRPGESIGCLSFSTLFFELESYMKPETHWFGYFGVASCPEGAHLPVSAKHHPVPGLKACTVHSDFQMSWASKLRSFCLLGMPRTQSVVYFRGFWRERIEFGILALYNMFWKRNQV